jgi:hypothetical protein
MEFASSASKGFMMWFLISRIDFSLLTAYYVFPYVLEASELLILEITQF